MHPNSQTTQSRSAGRAAVDARTSPRLIMMMSLGLLIAALATLM